MRTAPRQALSTRRWMGGGATVQAASPAHETTTCDLADDPTARPRTRPSASTQQLLHQLTSRLTSRLMSRLMSQLLNMLDRAPRR